jgi:hypothetical protein
MCTGSEISLSSVFLSQALALSSNALSDGLLEESWWMVKIYHDYDALGLWSEDHNLIDWTHRLHS